MRLTEPHWFQAVIYPLRALAQRTSFAQPRECNSAMWAASARHGSGKIRRTGGSVGDVWRTRVVGLGAA